MAQRKATPRGQMTRGANSGPAVMLMPPEIRATFMPNPPLESIPTLKLRRRNQWTGVSDYMKLFETTPPPERILQPTPQSIKEQRRILKMEAHQKKLEPTIEKYRKHQKECGGEYEGMNCYNTLFVGRLAYEVAERKLLREMEAFGPVKDIRIIKDINDVQQSRGYAFVEYEHEEDMKRAYRAADGMKIEGRQIVVDVERGHTVPTWLPRRLGGGLGGTRLGGKEINVTRPGRFDPNRPEAAPSSTGAPPMMTTMMMGAPQPSMGRGVPPQPPPPYYNDRGGPPPPPSMPPYGRGGGSRDDRYGPPPPREYRDSGRYERGSGFDRKRRRSRSPPGGGSRRRY